MERVLNPGADSVGVPSLELHAAPSGWAAQLRRLQPLWRHVVWAGALFTVVAFAVAVRLDVQAMRKDYERSLHAQREATVLNDRLRLEVDARRRAVAMEAAANALGATPDVRVVNIASESAR